MSSQPANGEQLQMEVANPYIIGDTTLDGDEDAQAIVFEYGAPARWALQCILHICTQLLQAYVLVGGQLLQASVLVCGFAPLKATACICS